MKSLSTERVQAIDVLRGVALAGILLVHATGEFAGWSSTYLSPIKADSLSTSTLDKGVEFLTNLLLVNKARTLFAFLFGVGFYYQLGKASRHGYRIGSRFAKRMLMLFIIGVLHAYLIWSGDILRMYAVCGLLLLLVYQWRPRALIIAGFAAAIAVPALFAAVHYYLPYSVLPDALKADMYEGYAGSRYTGLLYANLLRDEAIHLDPYSIGSYFIPIWGNFMFGYWAAQTGFISRLIADKRWLLRCLIFSGITGIASSNNAVRLIARLFHSDEGSIPVFWRSLLSLPAAYSVEATALFLLCITVYSYEHTFLRKGFSLFRYAGRMTLTNYIAQSLFAVLFFYGFGLGFISHYGSFVSLGFALLFFAVQLCFSYIWLSRFAMGPVEFLWRSMIEGKWQTMQPAKKLREV